MAAIDTRVVAAELKNNTAAIKTVVDALKVNVDALHTITDAFVVDGLDAALPDEAIVQEALENYDALVTTVSKPANSISDSLAIIRAYEPEE